MAKSTKSSQLAKFIQAQSAPEEDLRLLFDDETERLSVLRFRLCLVVIIFILLIPVSVDLMLNVNPVSKTSHSVRLGMQAILLMFSGLSYVRQFKKSSYAFSLMLSVLVGVYSVLIQMTEKASPLEHLAVISLFLLLMGFFMPWGPMATGGLCIAIYVFYPFGLALLRVEPGIVFIIQSNLYLLFFVAMAVVASRINETMRFEEFVLKKRMEGENALLQDYQTRLKRAYERMEHLALLDTLTGAYNRTYLTQWLRTDVYKDKTAHQLFSLLMFDLDHFKTINDMRGHQQGDRILQMITQIVKTSIFAQANIFRYGGDEFCVILPGTDLAEAVRIAERIRSDVEKDPDLFIRLSQVETIHVTLSLGITTEYVRGTVDPDYIIRWADASLLESKRQGRNCIHVFDPVERKIFKAAEWLEAHGG